MLLHLDVHNEVIVRWIDVSTACLLTIELHCFHILQDVQDECAMQLVLLFA